MWLSLLRGVYRFLLLNQVLLIIIGGQCAPKLGGIHFEQLLLETFMDEDNNTNANYKREFTVRFPAYHTNIKNTTSLYAKLTGHSISNSVISGSKHKNKKINTPEFAYAISNHSDFNYTTDLTTTAPTTISTSNMLSTSPLITAINTSNHSPNPETIDNNNTVIQELNPNEDLHKSKPKDNKSPDKVKSRRDAAILQSNGYAFNDDNCQMRGDRVLCGYNDQEVIATVTEPVDKDCILRGERIECGYVNPIAGNNRRNNEEKRALQTGSEITNATSNLTTDATTNTATETTHTVSLFDCTKISTPASTITNEPILSKIDTRELFDRVENIVASITTNASTTFSTTATTVFNISKTITNTSSTTIATGQPKLSRLMELIDRVEKILASADTTKNPSNPITASNKPTSSVDTQTVNSSEGYSLRARVSETHDSPVSSAGTIVVTNFNINRTVSTTTSSTSTTSSTTTSSTTTSSTTTTTTTTPVPYIDDGEHCVEKDGRIVCYDNYDNIQEEYDDDDFIEK